jgi:hypothetical protein
MLDYESLKTMARNIGRPIRDLLALAPCNDPFYAGVGFRRQAAEWFATIWADHGSAGSHLRRLHYQLVSSAARSASRTAAPTKTRKAIGTVS